jgi:hypothetical protein
MQTDAKQTESVKVETGIPLTAVKQFIDELGIHYPSLCLKQEAGYTRGEMPLEAGYNGLIYWDDFRKAHDNTDCASLVHEWSDLHDAVMKRVTKAYNIQQLPQLVFGTAVEWVADRFPHACKCENCSAVPFLYDSALYRTYDYYSKTIVQLNPKQGDSYPVVDRETMKAVNMTALIPVSHRRSEAMHKLYMLICTISNAQIKADMLDALTAEVGASREIITHLLAYLDNGIDVSTQFPSYEWIVMRNVSASMISEL